MNRTAATSRSGEGLTPNHESMMLTVRDAALFLCISRNLCYDLVNQDRLPHVRLGRRILLPREALERWLATEATVAPKPRGLLS